MIIRNVIEEVNLILFQQQTRCDRVNRSVTPPLVVEATGLVEEVEIVEIGLRAQPVETCNLKIGPLNI